MPMTVNKIFTAIGFSNRFLDRTSHSPGGDQIHRLGYHQRIRPHRGRRSPYNLTHSPGQDAGQHNDYPESLLFRQCSVFDGQSNPQPGPRDQDLPAGARCDLACSFLWLAGARREIDCQARIGLHAPRISRTFELTEPGNKLMANYMAEMGAPKEMIDLALQTDLSSATYSDHAQLRQWGLVNSPACPQSHPRNSGRRSGSPVPR